MIIASMLFVICLISWSDLFGQNEKSDKTIFDLDWNEVKDKIFPQLKQSLPLSDSTINIKIDDKYKPIVDKYVADILITYLIDYGNKFTCINQKLLTKWHIEMDSLRKTALNNLEYLSNSAKFQGDSIYAGIILDGNLEASLMLSANFWKFISELVKSKDIVIAIPARDVLLISHVGCEDGLEKLRKGVKQIYETGDHVITKWIFRRENETWIKYEYVE